VGSFQDRLRKPKKRWHLLFLFIYPLFSVLMCLLYKNTTLGSFDACFFLHGAKTHRQPPMLEVKKQTSRCLWIYEMNCNMMSSQCDTAT